MTEENLPESQESADSNVQSIAPRIAAEDDIKAGEYFRFQPIKFFQRLLSQNDKYTACKKQYERFQNPIKSTLADLIGNAYARIVIAGLVVAVGFYCLKSTGYVDTDNEIIAAFTVILAFVGVVQWWTTYRQLENMRLDQRPWLSVHAIEHAREYHQTFAIRLITRNTGKTPAQNVALDIGIALVPRGTFDSEEFARNPQNFTMIFEGVVIPPDGVREAFLEDAMPYIKTDWIGDLQGDSSGEYYFVLKYTYTDLAKGKYGTDHCCYWDPRLERFQVYGPLSKMF